MKRLFTTVAFLAMAAWRVEAAEPPKGQYLSTANGPVEFYFPAGWHAGKNENPYDLQCFSEDEKMMTGVFLFHKEDLAGHLTPRKLLEMQIDDLKSKRNNFIIKGKEIVTHEGGKKLTSILYSGEKNLLRYYYRFTLIEFKENPAMIAVVLQTGIPSYWDKQKPILEKITSSARIRIAEIEQKQ